MFELTYKQNLRLVKSDGWPIRYIKNPSEETQMTCVKRDRRAIEFIKHPSDEVKILHALLWE